MGRNETYLSFPIAICGKFLLIDQFYLSEILDLPNLAYFIIPNHLAEFRLELVHPIRLTIPIHNQNAEINFLVCFHHPG